ncbi:MAG: DUF748 domain-containing protein [Planctomycetota bacterium]
MTSPPKKRSWWRRWLWRLLVAAVVGRVLLALFLEPLLRLGAGFAGLDLQIGAAQLSLLGTSFRAEAVVVRALDTPEAPPLLVAKALAADLDASALLGGRLVVVEAEVSGAEVQLRRESDGRLLLPRDWLEPPPVAPVTSAPPAGAATPLRFDLPFVVHSARLHDVRLRFDDRHDRALYEGIVDLRVTELGDREQPGRIELWLHSPRWFDDAWLTATTKAKADHFELAWEGAVIGVRPHRLPLPQDVLVALADLRTVAVRLHGNASGDVRSSAPRTPELAGALHFELLGDEAPRFALDATLGPSVAGPSGPRTPFSLALQAPNHLRAGRVQDGELTFGEQGVEASFRLQLEGLTPGRFTEPLARRGITWPQAGLDLGGTFVLEAAASTSLEVRELELRGDDEALRLPRLRVQDLRQNGGELAIGDVLLEGPELTAARAADGSLRVCGLRFAASASTAAATASPGAAAPPAPIGPWPAVRLGQLRWQGAAVRFTDAQVAPEGQLELRDLALTADALAFGCDAPPGRLELRLRLADTVDTARLEATLRPSRDALQADLQLTADGVTLAALTPWLAAAGLAPELSAGSFRAAFGVQVVRAERGLMVAASVANLALLDGDRALLRVRNGSGEQLQIGPAGLDLGTWRLGEPFASVRTDADGTLHVLGLRTLAPAPGTTSRAAADQVPAAAMAQGPPPRADGTTDARTQPLHQGPPRHGPLRHGPLRLERAAVELQVAGRDEPLRLQLDAEVGAATAAPDPVPVSATVQFPGAVRELAARGSFTAGSDWQVALTLDGAGLDGRGLQGLLPPHLRCTLADGSLHAALEARADHSGFLATLRELRLVDRGEELLAVDAVDLPVLELDSERLHLGELRVAGVRGLATWTNDGLHLGGLQLGATIAAAPEASRTAPPQPGAPSTTPPPTSPPAAAAPPARRERPRLPIVHLDGASVALERFVLRDRRGADGEPMPLQATLTLAPFHPEPGRSTPLGVRLEASAPPLCRSFVLDGTLDPYVLQPTFDATLTAAGLAPKALARWSPHLGERIEGLVDDASLRASLHARLDLKRRDPREFDPTRAFAGEFSLLDTALLDTATGQPLAKVGALDVTLRAFDPASGDLLLRSVLVDDVAIAATRTQDGLELLGLRLRSAKPAANDGGPVGTSGVAPVATSTRPAAEFAVDHLAVQGLSVALRDATTVPPSDLPLADAELELDGFTTRGLQEAHPFRFRAAVRGGPVTLEQRVLRSSLLSGLVGSAGAAVLGGSDQHAMEQRPLLDEARVRGELQLFPKPIGTLQFDVGGFELQALRGLAKASGVELTDGLLDHTSSFVLRGEDGIDLASTTVFTWLSLREPPGGPISTYLRLPAPLDTVLFLLRNEADEQRIPLKVTLPSQRSGAGALTQAVVDALVAVLADAVASAAGRAGGVLTGAIGLSGANGVPDVSATWTFGPGDPEAGPADLASLLAAVAGDPTLEIVLVHELGRADEARANLLANPPRAELQRAVHTLRERQQELLRQRTPLAERVATAYAAGQVQEARTRWTELAALDRQLGELGRTLDQALDMSAGDTPRLQKRRAQAAAVALGERRLQGVRDALRRAAPDLPDAQVQTRRARAVVTDGDAGRVRAWLRRRAGN